jgi:hypothetical protein
LKGPEFERLKAVRAISYNAKLVAFVEKAHSSLQTRGRFKQRAAPTGHENQHLACFAEDIEGGLYSSP